MPRLLAIDYGKKRCGIAETDDLLLIASPVETLSPRELFPWLTAYVSSHNVQGLVVGQPIKPNGELADIEEDILEFIRKFRNVFPEINIHRIDESFSSVFAKESMVRSGMRKKQRRQKGNVDKIAATLILQEFLETRRNKSTQ